MSRRVPRDDTAESGRCTPATGRVKTTLVEYGFRLPSALDNRPLTFERVRSRGSGRPIYVSATPGPYELAESRPQWRSRWCDPTGLLDPEVEVRPTEGQIDDLGERRFRAGGGAARTARAGDDPHEADGRGPYRLPEGHWDQGSGTCTPTLQTLESEWRSCATCGWARSTFWWGSTSLREGLDLPEVSLVCILDADKEGFLRSETSLIQTIGRAARNVHGKVHNVRRLRLRGQCAGPSTRRNRRRKKQEEYNKKHGITPATVEKAVRDVIQSQTAGRSHRGKVLLGRYRPIKDVPRNAPYPSLMANS
jgi:excinuclease ABC subunit B